MDIKIVFADEDKEFLESFILYFIKNKSKYTHCDIISFDSVDDFQREFLENTFFVFGERFFKQLSTAFKEKYQGKIVVLSESITDVNTDDYLCICKYQKARKVLEAISSFVSENISGEKVNVLGAKSKLYMFFSPAENSGNSSISEAFSYIKSREYKVLHISLDSFYRPKFLGDAKYGLSDFFADIAMTDKLMRLEKYSVKDGNLHYILPFKYELDRSILDVDTFSDTIKYIVEKGDYDYISIDFRPADFIYVNSLMSICERLFISVGNSRECVDKYGVFASQLDKMLADEHKDKIISISNNINKEGVSVEGNYAIKYDMDMYLARDFNDELLRGSFCKSLRRIFDEG